MTATMTRRPAQRTASRTATGPTRPVPEMLLELAYRLHATRAVRRPISAMLPKKG